MTKKTRIATYSIVASILLLFSAIGAERKIKSSERIFAVEDSIVNTMEEPMEEDVFTTESETTLSSSKTSSETTSEQTTTTSTTQAMAESTEPQQTSNDTEVIKTTVSTAVVLAIATRTTTATHEMAVQVTTSRPAISEEQEVETTTTSAIDDSQYEPETGWISLDELTISLDMDVSKPSGLSKADFVTLMNMLKYDYNGYYKRNAELIWTLCQEYGMNEIFACGIIAQESGWARVAGWGKNNYFGISGGRYATEEEGLTAFIKLVGNSYLDENGKYYKGKTMHAVGITYCDGTNWPKAVYGCMNLIMRCK